MDFLCSWFVLTVLTYAIFTDRFADHWFFRFVFSSILSLFVTTFGYFVITMINFLADAISKFNWYKIGG